MNVKKFKEGHLLVVYCGERCRVCLKRRVDAMIRAAIQLYLLARIDTTALKDRGKPVFSVADYTLGNFSRLIWKVKDTNIATSGAHFLIAKGRPVRCL